MVKYRRAKVAGGCYFLTLALQDKRSDLLFKNAALLRRCLQNTQARLPFRVPALAVLPDHLHILMVLPPDDADFSARIRMLKASFVGALRQQVGSEVRTNAKGEANI